MFSFTPLAWLKDNLVVLALSLLALLGGYFYGHHTGYGEAEAKGKSALDSLKSDYAMATASATNKAAARLMAEIKKGQAEAAAHLATLNQLEAVQKLLQKRIPYVTTVYQTSVTSEPVTLPRTVFTRGYVRVLNHAFGAGGATCDESRQTSGADTAAESQTGTEGRLCGDDLLDSQVSQADLLAWAIDTGYQCQAERDQLLHLINADEVPHD